jgi:hypothetical protein
MVLEVGAHGVLGRLQLKRDLLSRERKLSRASSSEKLE